MALWQLDEFKPPQMLGFIRDVFEEIQQQYIGSQFLPNETTDDLAFEYILGGHRRPAMATVVSFDSEAPLAARPGAQKVSGELPPIKRKTRISEKEITRFMQPRSGTADVDTAINAVYNDTANLVEAIATRLEWLRMRALTTPELVYDESDVKFKFNFGFRPDLQWNLADGTDGNGDSVGTGGPWNDPDNATYIADMVKMVTYMQNQYGLVPNELLVPGQVIAYMQQSDELQSIILGAQPARLLNRNEVNNALASYGLPNLVANDATVAQEDADGNISQVRTQPKNRAVLKVSGPVGSTLLGPTAESRVLYGSQLQGMAPGVWGETYGTTEPPAEYTKVATVAFPSLPYADRVMQIKLFEDGGSGN